MRSETFRSDGHIRLGYIDWAKALGIIFICMGHILPTGAPLKVLLYCFHVPLFAFVGGMLNRPTATRKDLARKLWKTATRLLVPYTLWFWIFCVPYFVDVPLARHLGVYGELNFGELVQRFFFLEGKTIWNNALWFVPCYFLVCVIFGLFCHITRGNAAASGGVGIASLVLFAFLEKKEFTFSIGELNNFLGLGNVLLLFGFFAVGYALRWFVWDVQHSVQKPCTNPYLYAALVAFVGMAIAALRLNARQDSKRYNAISLLNRDYNDPAVFVSLSLCLVITFVLICGFLPQCKFADLLSRHSFFVMSTHYAVFLIPFVYLVKRQADWQGAIRQGMWETACLIALYVAVLVVLDKLWRKHPSRSLSHVLHALGILCA